MSDTCIRNDISLSITYGHFGFCYVTAFVSSVMCRVVSLSMSMLPRQAPTDQHPQPKNENKNYFIVDLLGTGDSCFSEGNPIRFLFKLVATKLLELEAELDGSISQGETLLCLVASMSSHLTCKDEKNLLLPSVISL